MGGYNLKGFVSALTIVIAHMLKWDRQPSKRTASWRRSIEEHRARVRRGLAARPAGTALLDAAVADAYRKARKLAAKETRMVLSAFPVSCPYTWDEIMGRTHEAIVFEGNDHG